VPADAALYVGDTRTFDVVGARAAGCIRCIWTRTPTAPNPLTTITSRVSASFADRLL